MRSEVGKGSEFAFTLPVGTSVQKTVVAEPVSAIRENSELQSLPVLTVTAYAMHGDREKILRLDLMVTFRNPSIRNFFSKSLNDC